MIKATAVLLIVSGLTFGLFYLFRWRFKEPCECPENKRCVTMTRIGYRDIEPTSNVVCVDK